MIFLKKEKANIFKQFIKYSYVLYVPICYSLKGRVGIGVFVMSKRDMRWALGKLF